MKSSMIPASVVRSPWREPYVWMVVGIPLLAICLGVVLLTIAREGADSLVDDNYYKRGVEINKDTAARQRAAQLRLALIVTQQPDAVCAHLRGAELPPAAQPLNLRFAHIARRSLDYGLELQPDTSGRCPGGVIDAGLQVRSYRLDGAAIQPGRWSVSLAAADWRLARSVGPIDPRVVELDSQDLR